MRIGRSFFDALRAAYIKQKTNLDIYSIINKKQLVQGRSKRGQEGTGTIILKNIIDWRN